MIDLTGRKFGRLTVIERSYPNRNEGTVWLCKCECGTEKIIRGHSLRRGLTKSCGCLLKEFHRLNFGLASMHSLIRKYKERARKRKLEFNLTEEQFKEITQKDCYYCGAKPNNIYRQKNCNGDYVYNGLDRVDNAKGYIINNVVPCCKICNLAKNNLTLQEFKDWIKKISEKIL